MQKTPIENAIAKVELLWLRRDANEVSVLAQIGLPYKIDDHLWACPAELKGIDSQYPDLQAGSSMQSICVAIGLLKTRLGHLLDEGELIFDVADRTEKLDRAYLDLIFAI